MIQVIRREVKSREEASEAFRGGGRTELAEANAEAEVLSVYLPRMIGGAELEEIVAAAIVEAGATSPKDMGKVMKVVMAAHGSQVDGKAVQAIVRARLGSA